MFLFDLIATQKKLKILEAAAEDFNLLVLFLTNLIFSKLPLLLDFHC